jgi:hypothetical protein
VEKKYILLLSVIIALIALYGVVTWQLLMAIVLITCIGIFAILLGYVGYLTGILEEHLQENDPGFVFLIAALIVIAGILISPLLLLVIFLFLLLWFRRPAARTEQ